MGERWRIGRAIQMQATPAVAPVARTRCNPILLTTGKTSTSLRGTTALIAHSRALAHLGSDLRSAPRSRVQVPEADVSITRSAQFALTQAVLCSAFCLCVASPLLAQRSDRAIITGVVTDQQGATVPGATVTVRNEATGVDTVLVTNAAGAYTTPPLVLGRYTVTVDLIGFKKAVSEDILVEGGQAMRHDVAMLLGGVDEIVIVSGRSALDVTTPDVSHA